MSIVDIQLLCITTVDKRWLVDAFPFSDVGGGPPGCMHLGEFTTAACAIVLVTLSIRCLYFSGETNRWLFVW